MNAVRILDRAVICKQIIKLMHDLVDFRCELPQFGLSIQLHGIVRAAGKSPNRVIVVNGRVILIVNIPLLHRGIICRRLHRFNAGWPRKCIDICPIVCIEFDRRKNTRFRRIRIDQTAPISRNGNDIDLRTTLICKRQRDCFVFA